MSDGTYSVTLTEQNALGQNATTDTDYIIVGGSGMVADFTATPTSGTAPMTVQFTDTQPGHRQHGSGISGTGLPGRMESPFHIYTNPGVYSVSLIATNSEGSNTFSQPDAITVSSVTLLPQLPRRTRPRQLLPTHS